MACCGPGSWRGWGNLSGPESLRHKDLDRLTDQFFPSIAEKILSLSVNFNDLSVLVYRGDRVRSGLKHDLEDLSGFGQLLLRAPSFYYLRVGKR